MNCNICNKSFTSKTNVYIHKREIHNHNNCKYIKCEFCEENFYSPLFNKNKKIPYYLKCEKCRELQIKLNTNNFTCFQKGGKMLDIYYNKDQIETFKNLLYNPIKNTEYNIKIKEIVKLHRKLP
jgi:hypothetical protein